MVGYTLIIKWSINKTENNVFLNIEKRKKEKFSLCENFSFLFATGLLTTG